MLASLANALIKIALAMTIANTLMLSRTSQGLTFGRYMLGLRERSALLGREGVGGGRTADEPHHMRALWR